MRQLVSITSLTAFLLHVLLGCCVHHAHAQGPVGCGRSKVPAPHHGCQHSTESHQQPNEQSHEDRQSPGERCDEPDCVFAACSKVELAKDSLVTGLAFDVSSPASAVLTSAACARREKCAAWKPPLRSHLMLRVLLI